MEIYDQSKIGARVAWGRSHSVYRYGTDEVIKFPRMERWRGILLRDGLTMSDRLKQDISICEQYLGDYFLTTRMVNSINGEVATIQPYLKGHYLSKDDLKDDFLRSRFREMTERYESMVDAGYEVDLIGQGGVLRRCLSNVLVLEDGGLKLFDATTLDIGNIHNIMYVGRLFINLLRKRQSSTIQFLLV